MAGLQLQPLPSAGQRFVDADGNLDPVARLALQAILDQIVDAVNGVVEAQAAAAAAQTAADAADAAAASAQTAADNAQTAADNAQAAVDAIVVPPTGARTVIASQTLLDTDYQIFADASGGAFTLELPLAATMSTPVIVIKTDATANAVDVEPGAGDTLNGLGVAVSLITQGEQHTFTSDGATDWWG
jgi:predicted  nucleic acid-binding Zn-ribbon protein